MTKRKSMERCFPNQAFTFCQMRKSSVSLSKQFRDLILFTSGFSTLNSESVKKNAGTNKQKLTDLSLKNSQKLNSSVKSRT
jgi:hypothetical protein